MNHPPLWTPIIISCFFVILSKMSMNKEICIFFYFFILLLLRVGQKALQLPVLLFFFFVLSSVFLNDPTSIFCTFDCCMYLWQYPPTHLRKIMWWTFNWSETFCARILHAMCFRENNDGRGKLQYLQNCLWRSYLWHLWPMICRVP